MNLLASRKGFVSRRSVLPVRPPRSSASAGPPVIQQAKAGSEIAAERLEALIQSHKMSKSRGRGRGGNGGRLKSGARPVSEDSRIFITAQLTAFQQSSEKGDQACTACDEQIQCLGMQRHSEL